jgi:23S rRNA (pseudouridine1915-N3)-methyltransferase
MKLLVVAVGNRMADWIDHGFSEYAKRMPRESPLQLIEIKPEPRTSGKTVPALMAAEAQRIRAALPERCRRLVLDERGDELTTHDLSARLGRWSREGGDIAFIVGGADGLDPSLKTEADERLRLSGLTLPHGLVRVILAEALYRAASLQRGHPYHRE